MQHCSGQAEPGTDVSLVREPDNPADPNAVAVLNATDEQIGYVQAKDAEWLSPLMYRSVVECSGFISPETDGKDISPGKSLHLYVNVNLGPNGAGLLIPSSDPPNQQNEDLEEARRIYLAVANGKCLADVLREEGIEMWFAPADMLPETHLLRGLARGVDELRKKIAERK